MLRARGGCTLVHLHFGTPSTPVLWYTFGTPGTPLVHPWFTWYTWYTFGTPGTPLVHLHFGETSVQFLQTCLHPICDLTTPRPAPQFQDLICHPCNPPSHLLPNLMVNVQHLLSLIPQSCLSLTVNIGISVQNQE